MEDLTSEKIAELLQAATEAAKPCPDCRGSGQKEILEVEGLDGRLKRQGFMSCGRCRGSGYANTLIDFHRTFNPKQMVQILVRLKVDGEES